MIGVFELQGQENWSKAEQRQLEDADAALAVMDFIGAMELYKPLLQSYPEDLHLSYKMGLCTFSVAEYRTKAKSYFEKSAKGLYEPAYYYYARCFHEEGDFDNAIRYYKMSLKSKNISAVGREEMQRQLEITKRAKRFFESPEPVRVTNLGASINTPFPDYAPIILADDSTLIFTSRRKGSTGELKDPYNQYFEDIYIAHREKAGWSFAKSVGEPVNTETHDACVGATVDGSQLLIYRTNRELTGGDIYLTKLEGEHWGKPELLHKKVNSDWQEASACFSVDGGVLYFSSNRPGGFGGKDIYKVTRLGADEWGIPENLGPTINTPFDEDAPFAHPDGTTFYFSSKGHETVGGYDVFKTTISDSGWSEPINLGYPINTTRDDVYFTVSGDGRTAYYSATTNDGFGEQDIYAVDLPGVEANVKIIKGFIKDKETNEPVEEAYITLTDLATGEDAGTFNANLVTGKYLIVLDPNIRYEAAIEAFGYKMIIEEIGYKGEPGFIIELRDIYLSKE